MNQFDSTKDYYGVLGVDKHASQREVDRGYKREAAKQGGGNALAPCRSDDRARRERFSARAGTAGRHRQAVAGTRRESDRPGQSRQDGGSGCDERVESSFG